MEEDYGAWARCSVCHAPADLEEQSMGYERLTPGYDNEDDPDSGRAWLSLDNQWKFPADWQIVDDQIVCPLHQAPVQLRRAMSVTRCCSGGRFAGHAADCPALLGAGS